MKIKCMTIVLISFVSNLGIAKNIKCEVHDTLRPNGWPKDTFEIFVRPGIFPKILETAYYPQNGEYSFETVVHVDENIVAGRSVSTNNCVLSESSSKADFYSTSIKCNKIDNDNHAVNFESEVIIKSDWTGMYRETLDIGDDSPGVRTTLLENCSVSPIN